MISINMDAVMRNDKYREMYYNNPYFHSIMCQLSLNCITGEQLVDMIYELCGSNNDLKKELVDCKSRSTYVPYSNPLGGG